MSPRFLSVIITCHILKLPILRYFLTVFCIMASIKVKFRPSTVADKKGTVFYQMTHKQRVRIVSTDIKLSLWEWDIMNSCLYDNMTNNNCQSVYNRIEADISHFNDVVDRLKVYSNSFTIDDICDMFFSYKAGKVYVLQYINAYICNLQQQGRWGQAINCLRMRNSFSNFLNGKDILFDELDNKILESYNDWLMKRNLMRNSCSFYLRVLRSVYNDAVNEGIVLQSFPFKNAYTGIDKTIKRAVNEEIIYDLYKLELDKKPQLAFARDIFIFSYGTRGMAFVDIAFLKKSDYKCGIIIYNRRKTRQRLRIKVEPCICELIERHSEKDDDSPYLFPILHSVDNKDAYREYRSALSLYNKRLKMLSNMLDCNVVLSSYTARHSWATAARNNDISLSVISAGMGHTSENTTRIYLASLDDSMVDDANRKLLEKLK